MDKANKQSFEEILSKALSLWPKEIHITERAPLKNSEEVRCADLVKTYDEVQNKLFDINDNFQMDYEWRH